MPRSLFDVSTDYAPGDPQKCRTREGLFPPYPQPKSELGIYRLLSPTAAVRVSPLCLGAMSIGDQWPGFMGTSLAGKEAFEFLDCYKDLGGNFIDTANNYQDEQSEMIIGEWMESRGIRDEIVLATKYTSFALDRQGVKFDGIGINFCGNHKKNLMLTVESSLKKLRTTYIDLLYVHWFDYTTSIPELMQSLNDLVRSGKVLYLGVSDSPSWVVAQANEYARAHGLAQFVIYQGAWNLMMRDMERDIIPMCRMNGMSIAPFSVLGSGKFKTLAELEQRAGTLRAGTGPTEAQIKMCSILQEIADELGGHVKLPHVALAWARQKVGYCFPIIGGASIANLKSNVEALKLVLSDSQMEKLEAAQSFDWGFPYAGFGRDPHYLPSGEPNSVSLKCSGHVKFVSMP
ncbi:putative aryl-alcohol dehydrogenase [Naematelia encephala]|uniref:Putative aryl-alcohol dehydrogenase n=1 Tax=Naematelia encephala TaxID=71784 RepID=A0A1Y2B2J9_9TREE|nr:putative aryl-alcohol dehydrogenase [Naematelia encephala]